jgi:DNA repair ATPase RecN
LINNVNAFLPSFIDRILEEVEEIAIEFRDTAESLELKGSELSDLTKRAARDITEVQEELSESRELLKRHSRLKDEYRSLQAKYSTLQSTF